MPGIRHPLMINGVPVVAASAEIDATAADQLRTVLLHSATRGHATIVVDMTRTRFCDSAGLTILVRAHKRAVADGGELRLIIPAGSAVARSSPSPAWISSSPLFASLDDGLALRPAAVGSSDLQPGLRRRQRGQLGLQRARAVAVGAARIRGDRQPSGPRVVIAAAVHQRRTDSTAEAAVSSSVLTGTQPASR